MAWRGQSSKANSQWRDTVSPIRQEARASGLASHASISAALEALVSQQAWLADLREAETSEDLAFLAQQLLDPRVQPAAATNGSPASAASGHGVGTLSSDISDTSACLLFCRLVSGLAVARKVRLSASAANIVVSTLRHWGDGGSTPDDGTGGGDTRGGGGTEQLRLEALQALGNIVQENLVQVSAHERAATLASLLSAAQSQSPSPQKYTPEPPEAQRLALTALGACCVVGSGSLTGGAGSSCSSGGSSSKTVGGTAVLTAEEALAVLQCTLGALQECCTGGTRLVEGLSHSRFYATAFKTLNAAIAETKRGWTPHATELVECLRRFLVYGLHASNNSSSTAADSTAASCAGDAGEHNAAGGISQGDRVTSSVRASTSGTSGGYRPPHLRRSSSSISRGGQDGLSDSDISESEGAGGTGGSGQAAAVSAVADRFRSSKVRILALSCLQSLTKSDPRAMHACWSSVLPLQQPLLTRPLSPTIVTMMLYDPVSRVRGMAAATIAALLEGPAQRSYVAVAEAKAEQQRMPVRGFTTLSTSLGQLVLSLHTALLHAVAHEPSGPVLSAVLRALCVLLGAAPYERLPPGLLPSIVEAIRGRWSNLVSTPDALSPRGGAGSFGSYLSSPSGPNNVLAAGIPAAAAAAGAPGTAAWPAGREVAALAAPAASAASSLLPATVHHGEVGALQIVFLACLAEALSTRKPSEGLRSYLTRTMVKPAEQAMDPLLNELLAASRDRQSVVRIEALAALQGLAINYPLLLPDIWRAVLELGQYNVEQCGAWANDRPTASRSPSFTGRDGGSTDAQGTAAGAPSLHQSAAPWQRRSETPAAAPSADKGAGGGGGYRGPRVSANGGGGSGAAAAPAARGGAGGAGASLESISPDDKAAQHAVKLVGDYLAGVASCRGIVAAPPASDEPPTQQQQQQQQQHLPPPSAPSTVTNAPTVTREGAHASPGSTSDAPPQAESAAGLEAAAAQIAQLWRDALGFLLPAAANHSSYMVRAAALRSLGHLPEAAFDQLDAIDQARLVDVLASAVRVDVAASVRAQAAKVLGAIVLFRVALRHVTLLEPATQVLAAAAQSDALAVRISACWALANACDGVRQHVSEAPAAAAADAAECQGRVLRSLCSATLQVVQDVDKVRANGVRAIGNMLAFLRPPAPAAAMPTSDAGAGKTPAEGTLAVAELDAWVSTALSCLQSCLTTGNMKVQWNACYALLGLFRNAPLLRHAPTVTMRVAPLLLLLVMLIRDSANFKIRTHAAAALAALPGREELGDVFSDALLVVASALEALDPSLSAAVANGGSSAAAASSSGPAAGSGTVDTAGVGADNGASAGVGGPGGDADEEGRFPNFRYISGLSLQLRTTLLQLLSLTTPADARRLREPLAKRGEFIRKVVSATVDAERSAAQQMAAAASGRYGSEGVGAGGVDGGEPLQLPEDPFSLLRGAASHDAAPLPVAAATAAGMGLSIPLVRGADLRAGHGAFREGSVAVSDTALQPVIAALRGLQRVFDGGSSEQHRQALSDVTRLLETLQMGTANL